MSSWLKDWARFLGQTARPTVTVGQPPRHNDANQPPGAPPEPAYPQQRPRPLAKPAGEQRGR